MPIIIEDAALQDRPDCLAYSVDRTTGDIRVSSTMADCAATYNLRTSMDFHSYLAAFPSFFVDAFGFDRKAVIVAAKKIAEDLVAGGFLSPVPVRRVGYGAMGPDSMPKP